MISAECPICSHSADTLNSLHLLNILESSTYRCNGCRSIFRFPLPGSESLTQYYASRSGRYSIKIQKQMAVNQAIWLRQTIENHCLSKEALAYVEYGAGQGWLVAEAAKYGIFKEVSGIEADPDAVKWGRRNLNVDLIQGFLGGSNSLGSVAQPRVPYVVALVHVLEHLISPSQAILHLKGQYNDPILFLEVPDVEWEAEIIEKDTFPWSSTGQHLWSFSATGLRQLLESVGYKVLELEAVGDKDFWKRRLRSVEVCRYYNETFERWRHAGGGLVSIMSINLHVLAKVLQTGIRNVISRGNRVDLPSIRILATAN